LRRLRHYSLELGDSYLQSVFLEMFGNPVTNPMGWNVCKLGNFIKFITSGSRGWAKYYSSDGSRFIRSLDVRMNHISNADAVYVNPPDGPERERTRVQRNDILLTITGSRIGRVAPFVIDIGEAFISQHVALIRLDDEISPQYISRFLSHPRGGQYQIERQQYGQTKPGLNLEQIIDFDILIPPKSLRKKYVEIVQRYDRFRSQQHECLRQSEHLFHSLLHRAFEGDL
jgi:type I restriction enzyme S subunit